MARSLLALGVVLALLLPTVAWAAPQRPPAPPHSRSIHRSLHRHATPSLPLSRPQRMGLASAGDPSGVLACSLQENLSITDFFLDDGTFLFADIDLTGDTACGEFPVGVTQQALSSIQNLDTGAFVAVSGITDCGPSPVCGSNPGTFAYGNTGNFDAAYLGLFLTPPGVTFNAAMPGCELGIGQMSLTCRLDIPFSLP